MKSLMPIKDDEAVSKRSANELRHSRKTSQESKIRTQNLLSLADTLVRKSVWIVGGDGWAYDIGYGGLDHVLASGETSMSLSWTPKSIPTPVDSPPKPLRAPQWQNSLPTAKDLPKKDLGMIAMTYGYIYVARVAMGCNDMQTLRAFREADAYDGPSLIIAYSHCIAHGIDMRKGLEQQKAGCAIWCMAALPLQSALLDEGKNPLHLRQHTNPPFRVREYAYNETRYPDAAQSDEERAETLMKCAQANATLMFTKLDYYRHDG